MLQAPAEAGNSGTKQGLVLVLILVGRLPAVPLTAPIHYQLRSRDVLACSPGQKHDSVGNIVSFSKHTKWNTLCDLFSHTLLNNQSINTLGSFYRARGNPVAANSIPPPIPQPAISSDSGCLLLPLRRAQLRASRSWLRWC